MQAAGNIFCLDKHSYAHIMRGMTHKSPLQFIRENLFRATQSEFGEIAKASQPVVSRWENGLSEPTREQMQNIRNEAARRGLVWNDTLFFSVPREAAE